MNTVRIVAAALTAIQILCGYAQTQSILDSAPANDQLAKAQEKFRRSGELDDVSVSRQIADLSSTAERMFESNELPAAASAWLRIAACKRFLYDYGGSNAAFGRALEVARRANSDQLKAAAFRGLAETELDLKRAGPANGFINEGIAIAQRLGDGKLRLAFLILRGRASSALSDARAAVTDLSTVLDSPITRSDFDLSWKAFIERASVYLDIGLGCGQRPTQATEDCLKYLDKSEGDYRGAMQAAKRSGFPFAETVALKLAVPVRMQKENLYIRSEMHRRSSNDSFEDLGARVLQFQQELRAEREQVEKIRAASGGPGNPFLAAAWDELWPKTEALVKQLSEMLASLPKVENKPKRVSFRDPLTRGEVLKPDLAAPVDQDLEASLVGMASWVSDRGEQHIARSFREAQRLFRDEKQNEALTAYIGVLDELESERSSINGDRSRSLLMEGRIELYDKLILNLLQRERYSDAFALLEKTRARTLAELLAARPPVTSPQANPVLADIFQLRAQIGEVTGSGKALSAAQADVLTALNRKLDVALAKLRQLEPKLLDLYTPKLATFDDVRALASGDRFDLIQYVVTPSKVVIWHIGPTRSKAVAVLLNREQLTEKLEALQSGLRQIRDSAEGPAGKTFNEEISRQLFLFLLDPVRDNFETNHLIIVPRDELANVPFAVLQSPDGKYVGETYQISIAPSATVLLTLPKSSNLAQAKTLAIANTRLITPSHAKRLARLNTRSAVLPDPSFAQLKTIEPYDAIYFAVHGTFRGDNPMLAKLVLSGLESSPNNVMTAAEAFALPLHRAKVVVIGACDVGRVAVERTNEMYGIARALLYAGANSLVLPYWKVDNEAATAWAEVFFSEAASHPFAEAARRALISIKGKYPDPRDWAAFYYLGR